MFEVETSVVSVDAVVNVAKKLNAVAPSALYAAPAPSAADQITVDETGRYSTDDEAR